MVECNLPKVEVEGSTPFARSMKALDCFLPEVLLPEVLPYYDKDPELATIVATPEGLREDHTGRARTLVPLWEMPEEELERYAADVLVRAARDLSGYKEIQEDLYPDEVTEVARYQFDLIDLPFCGIVDCSPLFSIAVSDPEYVGRLIRRGKETGLMLFNPRAVFGFRPRSGKRPLIRSVWDRVRDED